MQIRSLVGYTSSNRPIYQYGSRDFEHITQSAANFSAEDNFDAMAVFSYIQLIYWRRYGENSQDYNDSRSMMEFFESRVSEEYENLRKVELGLITSIDISNYGRKHCLPYLQELIGS